MNTKLKTDLHNSVTKKDWDALFSFKDDNEEIQYEAQMLMYSFLGEVEKFQSLQGINKKGLAEKIKNSASYLTQLFRGNKPLNFETIAKFQKALNIRFKVSAIPIENTTLSLNIERFKYVQMPFEKMNGGKSELYTVKGGKLNEGNIVMTA